MDATILKNYESTLADGLARLRGRTRQVNGVDVVRIFGPVFEDIARVAGGKAPDLAAWVPADVTDTSLRDAVRAVVASAIPPVDMEYMRRKTAELQRELAAPLGSWA